MTVREGAQQEADAPGDLEPGLHPADRTKEAAADGASVPGRSTRIEGMGYRSSRHGRAGLGALVVALAWAQLATVAFATPVTDGFRDFSYGTSASAPTADKPQSKLWFLDGRWWGVLFNASTRRFEIYGFNR